MTTPRTRRTKGRQARDLLTALLNEQKAQVAKDEARLEASRAERDNTKRALESLGIQILTEAERIVQPISEGGTGDDLRAEGAEANLS